MGIKSESRGMSSLRAFLSFQEKSFLHFIHECLERVRKQGQLWGSLGHKRFSEKLNITIHTGRTFLEQTCLWLWRRNESLRQWCRQIDVRRRNRLTEVIPKTVFLLLLNRLSLRVSRNSLTRKSCESFLCNFCLFRLLLRQFFRIQVRRKLLSPDNLLRLLQPSKFN